MIMIMIPDVPDEDVDVGDMWKGSAQENLDCSCLKPASCHTHDLHDHESRREGKIGGREGRQAGRLGRLGRQAGRQTGRLAGRQRRQACHEEVGVEEVEGEAP